MVKLILILLALMSLGMEAEASCEREVDSRLSLELKDKGFAHHAMEFKMNDGYAEVLRDSEQLTLTQKLEIEKYAATGAVELFFVVASNGSENYLETLVVNVASCEVLRNYKLFME